MAVKELRELFCAKLCVEIERYKKRVQRMSTGEMIGSAYQITYMLCIYEQLVERSQTMDEDTLKCLLVFPNIHSYIYHKWLKYEDSMQKELEDSIERSILAILRLGEEDTGTDRQRADEAA